MTIKINRVEYYQCLDCGSWTHGLCKCREESKSNAVVKFIKTMRKQNNHLIMITPHGKVRDGMSNCGIDISKFALRGN